jgi:hypothetical protein
MKCVYSAKLSGARGAVFSSGGRVSATASEPGKGK